MAGELLFRPVIRQTRAGFKIKKIRCGQVTCYMNEFPLDGVFADDSGHSSVVLLRRLFAMDVYPEDCWMHPTSIIRAAGSKRAANGCKNDLGTSAVIPNEVFRRSLRLPGIVRPC